MTKVGAEQNVFKTAPGEGVGVQRWTGVRFPSAPLGRRLATPSKRHEMITHMGIEEWWTRLTSEKREWLIAHNGEALPADVVSAIRDAGDELDRTAWWWDGTEDALTFSDQAIDWIEAVANDEDPSDR